MCILPNRNRDSGTYRIRGGRVSILYEVVTGQIALSKRKEFFALHSEILLPMMKSVGIKPVLLLMTEIGRYGRFLDIYQYADFADYEARTDALLRHPEIEDYYKRVGECVHGGIEISLMRQLPYNQDWT